jgi:hypothetical protein
MTCQPCPRDTSYGRCGHCGILVAADGGHSPSLPLAPCQQMPQLADVMSPQSLAIDAQQASQLSPLGASQSANDLARPAASADLPPADRAVQEQLPAPQHVHSESSVQQSQQAQAAQSAASQYSSGVATVPHAATACAPQPMWMPQEIAEPAPPQTPGKRGFWGTIGAYIAGADKRLIKLAPLAPA